MRREIENLKEKISNDYQVYSYSWLMSNKECIYNNAYTIATAQNFYDAICDYIKNYEEDDSCNFALSEFATNKLLNCEGNLIQKLLDSWQNFRHPERYDFWYEWYEGLVNIIEIIAKEQL